jgi:undecaprenyl-diphosphatase
MSDPANSRHDPAPEGADGPIVSERRANGGIAGNVDAVRWLLNDRRARAAGPKKGVRWLLFAFCVGCVVLLFLALLDAPAGGYRRQWPDGVRMFARAITDIGESTWYLVPTGVFIVLALALDWRRFSRRRRWLMANWFALSSYIFLTIGGSGLIATILKRIIGRARPKHFEEHGLFAFDNFATDASFASFPSGHATTVGALMAMVGLLFPRLRVAALLLAVALASTRIFVGAHYPSDVAAGLGFGMWFAYFMAVAFAGRGIIFTFRSSGLPVVRPSFARFIAATPLKYLPISR